MISDFSFAQVQSLWEIGEEAKALELLHERLDVEPDDGRSWEFCGLIYHGLQEFDRARHALETATTLTPLSIPAQFTLAHCYAQDGKSDLAKGLLRHVLASRRSSAPMLLQVAVAFDRLDEPALALKACRDAAHIAPDFAQSFYDMGFYMGRCGYPPHMIETVIRKAISIAPERTEFRVGYASMLHRARRFTEAYQLIRHFTADEIAEIVCFCCLERIVDVFDRADDKKRADLCRNHARLLYIQQELADGSS